MTKTISALTARTQLGQIMERCAKGERFVVLRNGKPSIIMIGVVDYYRHVLKKPKKLRAFLAKEQGQKYRSLLLIETNRSSEARKRETRKSRGSKRQG